MHKTPYKFLDNAYYKKITNDVIILGNDIIQSTSSDSFTEPIYQEGYFFLVKDYIPILVGHSLSTAYQLYTALIGYGPFVILRQVTILKIPDGLA